MMSFRGSNYLFLHCIDNCECLYAQQKNAGFTDRAWIINVCVSPIILGKTKYYAFTNCIVEKNAIDSSQLTITRRHTGQFKQSCL